MVMTVGRDRAGFQPPLIALLRAAVHLRIAIQYFLPEAAMRNPDPVIVAHHRSKIADDEHPLARRAPFTKKTQDTVIRIIAVDPHESTRVTITLVERWLATVESIEVRNPLLQAGMRSMLK